MRTLLIIITLPILASGAEINVHGNEAVPTGEILAAAGTGPESPDAAAVERLYDSYGYLDARVELPPDGGMLVINEGPAYRLAGLSVIGDLPYTRGEVVARVGIDRGEPLSIRALERGLAGIMENLRDEGYVEARAIYAVDKNPSAGTVDVTLDFSAGYLYTVGEISFLGVGAFIEDALRARMETREGTRFSEARLGADILNIIDLYRENGYAKARAVPGRFILAKTFKAIDFTIFVDEGPRVIVGEIRITGARRTRPAVVNRELTIKTDEPYDISEIRKSQRRIYLLKYFKRPPDITLTDAANGIIEVAVEERRTYAVSGALGYEPASEGTSANLLGYVSASIHNFLGTGRDIDAGYSRPGKDNVDVYAAYYEPWIGGVDLFARPEAKYRERPTYRKLEGELTLGTHPFEGLTVAAGGGFARVRKTDPSRTIKAIFRSTYDTRDYFPNPRIGWQLSLETEVGFKEYFDDGFRDLVPTAELDAWRYFPVTRATVLAARLKAAGVFAGRESDDEYLYLGGPRDLRGFRNEQFPVSHYALATAEYRFLVGRGGRLFLFADGAYRRREATGGTSTGFELGYGAGFRAPTGLGTYGVDFAVPAGVSPLDGKIHVTITQEF